MKKREERKKKKNNKRKGFRDAWNSIKSLRDVILESSKEKRENTRDIKNF